MKFQWAAQAAFPIIFASIRSIPSPSACRSFAVSLFMSKSLFFSRAWIRDVTVNKPPALRTTNHVLGIPTIYKVVNVSWDSEVWGDWQTTEVNTCS